MWSRFPVIRPASPAMRESWSMAALRCRNWWRSTSSSGLPMSRWWHSSGAESLLLEGEFAVLHAPGFQAPQEFHAEQGDRHLRLVHGGRDVVHDDRPDLQRLQPYRCATHRAVGGLRGQREVEIFDLH